MAGTTSTVTVLYASKQAREGTLATGMTEACQWAAKRLDDLLALGTAG